MVGINISGGTINGRVPWVPFSPHSDMIGFEQFDTNSFVMSNRFEAAPAAGLVKPYGYTLDGTSLVPLLKDPLARLGREAIYFHYPHYHHSRPAGAIRAGDLKLIEFFDTGEVELYDLGDDIGESTNLAGKAPQRARELQKKLAAWRVAVRARMPTTNPKYDAKRTTEWWSRRTGQPLDVDALKKRYDAEKAMMKRWTGEDWN